ncbi:MAG: DUF835 domain-containing protein [Candidatus Saliniplasma sp.]
MTDLVSMPTKIIPYLRMTIEEVGSKEEANFAIYHLGYEWGQETVKLSGEKSDLEDLKTKTVLTAIHSGITKLEVEINDSIDITPFESNIDDDHFLAGYSAGVISGLLGEYHIAKQRKGYFTVEKSERKVEDDFFEVTYNKDKKIDLKNLKRGESYIIEDNAKDARRTFNTFTSAVKDGLPGLCFTRTFPSKIKDDFPELQFPIFWLSTVDGTEKIKTIQPSDFCHRAVKISSAFSNMNKGIFMLHGIGFLLSYLDFEDVLKTIQKMKDVSSVKGSIFLLPVDPKTVEKDHFNRLKSELTLLQI